MLLLTCKRMAGGRGVPRLDVTGRYRRLPVPVCIGTGRQGEGTAVSAGQALVVAWPSGRAGLCRTSKTMASTDSVMPNPPTTANPTPGPARIPRAELTVSMARQMIETRNAHRRSCRTPGSEASVVSPISAPSAMAGSGGVPAGAVVGGDHERNHHQVAEAENEQAC